MKTIAIIQARVGSTRLPGKILLTLEGKTVLERVIDRVKASKLVDEVVVATTVSKDDLKVVALCASIGVRVFCGSAEDVLDRYFQAARLFGAEQVVRITADCPLLDPRVVEQTIDAYVQSGADYVANQLEEKFPDGQDVEVFSFQALQAAWQAARLASEREHVTPYIKNHPERFKIAGVATASDHSQKRWTLDNAEDYEFIKAVYARLIGRGELFGMKEILDLLEREPALEKINSHIARNEGYAKSLREDTILEMEGHNG